MAVYGINYDLNRRGKQDYEGLIARLKKFGAYCHETESSWFVVSTWTAVQVRDYLTPPLDVEDKLSVVPVGQDWALNRFYPPVDGESTEPGTVADWLFRWLQGVPRSTVKPSQFIANLAAVLKKKT